MVHPTVGSIDFEQTKPLIVAMILQMSVFDIRILHGQVVKVE